MTYRPTPLFRMFLLTAACAVGMCVLGVLAMNALETDERSEATKQAAQTLRESMNQ